MSNGRKKSQSVGPNLHAGKTSTLKKVGKGIARGDIKAVPPVTHTKYMHSAARKRFNGSE